MSHWNSRLGAEERLICAIYALRPKRTLRNQTRLRFWWIALIGDSYGPNAVHLTIPIKRDAARRARRAPYQSIEKIPASRATKNLFAVMKAMGHAAVATTMKYQHQDIDEIAHVASQRVQ